MKLACRCFGFAALVLLLTFISAAVPQPVNTEAQEDASAERKYAKYIFTDVTPFDLPPEELDKIREEQRREESMVDATRLLNLDKKRAEGAPYLDFVWLWEGSAKGYAEKEHVHDFDEFIGFIGVQGKDDSRNLGAEIEVWLGGEKYMITQSCLIYVPKGMRHCPVKFNRIDSPVLFFTGGMATSYSRTPTDFSDAKADERNHAKYFSYSVNPEKISGPKVDKWDEEAKKRQSTVDGTRYLDLDSVEGAPYIDFVYLWSGSENGPNHPEHAHDWGEVFGFIGTGGRGNTGDLGGEIEFWLGGEKYVISKSSLVWVPPGMKHCPIQFLSIDRPFILFTLGMTREYTLMAADE